MVHWSAFFFSGFDLLFPSVLFLQIYLERILCSVFISRVIANTLCNTSAAENTALVLMAHFPFFFSIYQGIMTTVFEVNVTAQLQAAFLICVLVLTSVLHNAFPDVSYLSVRCYKAVCMVELSLRLSTELPSLNIKCVHVSVLSGIDHILQRGLL